MSTTQEIHIQAQITLEVPIELSKKGLELMFNGCLIRIDSNKGVYISKLEIIEIEEEVQIYGDD